MLLRSIACSIIFRYLMIEISLGEFFLWKEFAYI
nr:MAG TPA: hypothetical protein [Caudoviricetes sp.]DAQ99340.1 MAG TPA: hypothetical protein [Caudoviricetes sp.]